MLGLTALYHVLIYAILRHARCYYCPTTRHNAPPSSPAPGVEALCKPCVEPFVNPQRCSPAIEEATNLNRPCVSTMCRNEPCASRYALLANLGLSGERGKGGERTGAREGYYVYGLSWGAMLAQACNPMCSRLQPYVRDAATSCGRSLQPYKMLQPYVRDAATLCGRSSPSPSRAACAA